ncbi:hypothetical protein [Bauldia litoralis]|uniref:hypothetical protein n=1 Tax=Bauldia litoralis TaxID=665467 RepID=UPI003264A3E5
MRFSRPLSAVVAALALPLSLMAATPGQAASVAAPDTLFATPDKARSAAGYWTFDRMDRARPRLPDLLDPVTMKPVRRQ